MWAIETAHRARLVSSLLLAGCFSLFLAPAATAVTFVPGGNLPTTTWTQANSPYIVQGDVTVQAGQTLTIQAGTSVLFASTDSQASGLDAARVELTINGALAVQGALGSPVQFQAQNGSGAGIWYGIVVNVGANPVAIANAVVQNAVYGIRSLASGTVSLSNSTARTNSQAGIALAAGAPLLDRVVASANGYGILVTGGSPTISNSRVFSNSIAGISVAMATGTTTVEASTIHANGAYGINVAGGDGKTTTITNSIVTSQNYGVNRADGSTVDVTYSDVWGNTSADFQAVAPGTGSFSSNPLYVSAPGNLRLTSNSPARFASNAGQDIGALPYVSDATSGFHGVLWTNTLVTAADGPVLVGGDLTVAEGVTLTLDPGVTLRWNSSDIMASGADILRGELAVRGTLFAQGTSVSPVVLTCVNAVANCWGGAMLTASSTDSTLRHATVEHAFDGVHLGSGSHTIDNVLTRNHSHAGIAVSGGSPALDALRATGSPFGVYVSGSPSPTVTNAVIQSNTTAGIAVVSTGGTTTLDSSTVYGNPADGILVSGNSAESVVVRNSIVAQNGFGVRRTDSASVDIVYSDVWGNTTDYGGASPSTGVISVNPLFVSPPTNLRLQPASVAIDMGAPPGPDHDLDGNARPLDGDGLGGAQFDMGAYEFRLVASGVISGTKTVSGSFAELGAVAYTVTLTNSGAAVQGDNPGDEFSDTLPPSLTLVSANASSGTATTAGSTVHWNGSISAGGSVTVTIAATVNVGTAGQFISNQGTVTFDGNGDGLNETDVLTDDPGVGGASDPTVFQATAEGSLAFYSVAPCRVLDTRNALGPLGGPALNAGTDRTFTIVGACGIPATAKAISVNLAVTGSTGAGNLRLHPGGAAVPLAASINYAAGQTRANNSVVPLNPSGQLGVFCAQGAGTAHLILDVNGYFQ